MSSTEREAAVAKPPVDHEKSYRGWSAHAFLHRTRLRSILRALRRIPALNGGRIGDFGCSNGFILARLRELRFPYPAWEMWGFDHAPHYIEDAVRRRLPGASFEAFDLDVPSAPLPQRFHVVLCLETLEHTGSFRTALRNVARATELNGYLLVSVPNERGLPGLLKFFGRKILVRADYHGFFRGRSQLPYLRALLTGADLEAFRQPPRHGWAEHLGFDMRAFEAFLQEELLSHGSFEMVAARRLALGFGRLYLLRRLVP